MKTLRETLDTSLVKYRLEKTGTQVIQIPRSATFVADDGEVHKIEKKAIYLSRAGDGRATDLSHGFDPNDPEHSKYIEIVDQWIEKNPAMARKSGVEKVGTKRPEPRIDNWDNMSPEQLEVVVEAMEPDLLWAMEYELHRPEELGGPREEVIEILEEIHARGFQKSIEQSEEAPAL